MIANTNVIEHFTTNLYGFLNHITKDLVFSDEALFSKIAPIDILSIVQVSHFTVSCVLHDLRSISDAIDFIEHR